MPPFTLLALATEGRRRSAGTLTGVPGNLAQADPLTAMDEPAVKDMSPDKADTLRKELLVAAALVGAGLVMSALSLTEIRATHPQVAGGQVAQGTPPLQSSPPSKNDAPAESKPGGTRPTTPAPEPARPDVEAQKEGAKPALPPAPAEKMAPPIKDR